MTLQMGMYLGLLLLALIALGVSRKPNGKEEKPQKLVLKLPVDDRFPIFIDTEAGYRAMRAYAEADVVQTWQVMEAFRALDAFLEMYYYHGNGD